jgi:hypothetical protein
VAHAAERVGSAGDPSSASALERPASPWVERAVAAVDRDWRWYLAALMLLAALLLLYMGRGLSFFYDDWDFVTHDYGGGIHSLLVAHVGNPVIFPVVVYKVLFHLVGLNHYAVFRMVVIVLHLACGGLVFVLAARRISRVNALLAAALILFLGAAWEDLLWAFQVTYMLSITGGLAAWVLLEREDRASDVAAMMCLIVAAGSSNLGVAIMLGTAVELAWGRRWRSGWIVVVPAVLYGLWYLHYGENQLTASGLINAPGYAEDLAAAAFGGLVGRGLEWGRPLALLGVLLVSVELVRARTVSARLAGLIATGIGLWTVTALARSTISPPESSRYVYLGAVVIVLTGVELLRGVAVAPRATALATVLVAACALTGLTALHAGALGLRSTSKVVTAELGALQIAGAYAPPSEQPDPQRAPQIMAGPYLHTVRAIGSSPADTPAEIIASEPAIRDAADALLIKLEGQDALGTASALTPVSASYPAVADVAGPPPIRARGCWSTRASGANAYTEFVMPTAGLLIRAGSQAVQVVARRFSPPLGGVELGAVAPRKSALVRFPVDAYSGPWLIRLSSGSPIVACGVR